MGPTQTVITAPACRQVGPDQAVTPANHTNQVGPDQADQVGPDQAVRATVLSLGLVGGIATASTAPAAATSDQPSPPNTTQMMALMDQHMRQMLPLLPADQRAPAQRMHEQMRPQMEKMMSGHDGTGSMMGGQNSMMGSQNSMMGSQNDTGGTTGG